MEIRNFGKYIFIWNDFQEHKLSKYDNCTNAVTISNMQNKFKFDKCKIEILKENILIA